MEKCDTCVFNEYPKTQGCFECSRFYYYAYKPKLKC